MAKGSSKARERERESRRERQTEKKPNDTPPRTWALTLEHAQRYTDRHDTQRGGLVAYIFQQTHLHTHINHTSTPHHIKSTVACMHEQKNQRSGFAFLQYMWTHTARHTHAHRHAHKKTHLLAKVWLWHV
eukprot:GDKI01041639.1.p2 GENE.GDKI01041639.1~~GDKI01041639.1.p2  ORF type:complete len:130 (+),score=43.04 GDKI01041639.1:624-1013(+)